MPEYVQLCKHREETIERVIADAGGKHAMSYTQHRGLAQVTYRAKLKFAAMNLNVEPEAPFPYPDSLFLLL